MTVKITPNDKGNPPGKLADAELHFTDLEVPCPSPSCNSFDCPICGTTGKVTVPNPLAGLKLVGFGIWERRTGNGRNVTFPARQYSVNGERRSFALLRPIVDAEAQSRVRDLILRAYADLEEQESIAR